MMFLHDSISDENRYCLNEYNGKKQQCVHVVASEQKDAVEKMELLTLWGADLNAKELEDADTPLHIAVKVRNYELAEWLCQQPNVNKEALNDYFMTPYHIAFFGRDEKMMDLLKQNGAQCRVPMQSETNSVDDGYEPPCKNSKN